MKSKEEIKSARKTPDPDASLECKNASVAEKCEGTGQEILIGWMGSVTMLAGWERLRVQGPSF
jgi:hypothetical protein